MPKRFASIGITEPLQLLRALEARDPVVFAHSLRVGTYARSVGRVLGWEDEGLDQLETAARLHDLGKLTLPPSSSTRWMH